MAYSTFSQTVSDFRMMSSGINNRLSDLTTIGIVVDDAMAMASYAEELDLLNSEQEQLKALLRAKTGELNNKLQEAKAKHAHLTKRVKLTIPQKHWVAFGITAKR